MSVLSHNYENVNYVMTQILKLSSVSFSYVLAYKLHVAFIPTHFWKSDDLIIPF